MLPISRILAFAMMIVATVASGAAAQAGPSRIVTNGNGEVSLRPDWATMALNVTADDSSASAAASSSTAATERVLAALAALGFAGDSVVRVSYSVGPRYDWSEGQRILGYRAQATIRIDVRDLDRLAAIIDTTLAAGATAVSGLRFGSDREEEARVEALRQAVAQARADAEVLANAAGGRLGRPLELSTERTFRPSFALSEIARARSGPSTAPDLTPQDVVVLVVVQAEWELLRNPD
jgi:uncharacterized protein YggE